MSDSEAAEELVLTRSQVRDVDRRAVDDYGMTGLVLMENAGRNAAQLLMSSGIRGLVSVCCGKGNNAGDGFVVARHLENAGVRVEVLLATEPELLTGDAAANFAILQKAQTPVIGPPVDGLEAFWKVKLAQSDWIVDGLLGTGARGTVGHPLSEAIAAINTSGQRVFSLDLPSGLDCETGLPLGCCVRAIQTATFVARKPGFDAPGAKEWTGEVHVLDIGAPRRLLDEIRHSGSR